MRNYELMFVADPRLTDEEFTAMSDDYKRMLTEGGAEIVAEENWGRRKLAYPIDKIVEGRYMVLFLTAAEKNPLPTVEHRMRQNEKILRYLTVRTEKVHPTPVAGPEDEAPRRRFDEDGPPRRGGRYDDDGGGRRGGGRYDDDRGPRRDAEED